MKGEVSTVQLLNALSIVMRSLRKISRTLTATKLAVCLGRTPELCPSNLCGVVGYVSVELLDQILIQSYILK